MFQGKMDSPFPLEDLMYRDLVPLVQASLFAAFTAAGAYVVLPLGPVPLTLQSLFVLLAGVFLGSKWGAASMGVYLLLGSAGFPVFSMGRSGVAILIGPTGGFLIGFPLAAWIVGRMTEKLGWGSSLRIALSMLSGLALLYLTGMAYLWAYSRLPLEGLAGMGALLLPGDVLKLLFGTWIASKILAERRGKGP